MNDGCMYARMGGTFEIFGHLISDACRYYIFDSMRDILDAYRISLFVHRSIIRQADERRTEQINQNVKNNAIKNLSEMLIFLKWKKKRKNTRNRSGNCTHRMSENKEEGRGKKMSVEKKNPSRLSAANSFTTTVH